MNTPRRRSLPILHRHLNRQDRYLRPEAIYSLNRVLYEFLDTLSIFTPQLDDNQELGNTQAWVVPFLFDPRTRSWHFACVLPEVWSEHRNIEDHVLKEVLWLVTKIAFKENLYEEFSKANNNLLDGTDYSDAYASITSAVARVRTIRPYLLVLCPSLFDPWKDDLGISCEPTMFWNFTEVQGHRIVAETLGIKTNGSDDIAQERANELVRSLLLMFHGYRTHRKMYLSGILYRNLARYPDCAIDRIDGTHSPTLDDPYSVKRTLFSVDGKPIGEKEVDEGQFKFKLNDTDEREADYAAWAERGIELGLELSLPFYLRNMAQAQQRAFKKNEALPFTILPIHDTWLGNVGYGGLWGALLCTFPVKEDLRKFNDGNPSMLDRLKPVCEILSEELTMSALTTVTSLPIVPPYDLVEHFVRSIVTLQDWERVTVYRKGSEAETGKRVRLYCYRRFLDCRFAVCESRNCGNCDDYKRDFTWGRCQQSSCAACTEPGEGGRARRILKWEDLKCEIWSRDLMPEISDEEIAAFSDIVLEFEFPSTSTIPQNQAGTNDETHQLFELAVIQRQIEVLRALIPKVRVRRAALRSAVSAIMGRNMSHNIGSHVLARYSSAIKHDLDPASKEKTDHRTDFLNYLQRRMDFLAEVATSEQSFWEQAISLQDVINKLNYKKQEDVLESAASCEGSSSEIPKKCSRNNTPANAKRNKPILLSYITGKDSLDASVAILQNSGASEDLYFSCPGGEVGAHALYVILENIIRNSARHAINDGKTGKVEIQVAINVSSDNDKLIKLNVIDPRTELDKDGWILNEGTRVGERSLTKHINHILTTEPFLNDNGSTNPKYWGVREMQICAHYLRGFPFGDIEGDPEEYPVLEASPWSTAGGVGTNFLSYTLYIKPAKLLAYVEVQDEVDATTTEVLPNGIKRISLVKATNIEWQHISAEARGYGFLVMPTELMTDYTKMPEGNAGESTVEDQIRHVLPVRTIGMPVNEIQSMVKSAKMAPGLMWMQPVYKAMIQHYRNNSDPTQVDSKKKKCHWGNGKVYAVVGWDSDRGLLTSWMDEDLVNIYQVRQGDVPTNPFEAPVDVLPEAHTAARYCANVGVAWLSHPTDPALSESHLRSASIEAIPTRNWASAEPRWSDSPQSKILENLQSNGLGEGIHELVAAAFARVVVLDERIQSRRHDKVREITLYKYWPQAGIWCPLHPADFNADSTIRIEIEKAYHDSDWACNLDVPNFNKIRAFLVAPTKLAHQFPADFFVLHLTILENLNKQRNEGGQKEDINTTLLELKKGTKCEKAQVIIVTGRGVASVARQQQGEAALIARFLPISALQEYLITRPSKLGLMRVLWAAAAPRPDN